MYYGFQFCFYGVPVCVIMYVSASACVSRAFFLALFLLLACTVLFEFVCLFLLYFSLVLFLHACLFPRERENGLSLDEKRSREEVLGRVRREKAIIQNILYKIYFQS